MRAPDGRIDELIPPWLFVVRSGWPRLVVALGIPALVCAPLVAYDDAPAVRFGPLLVLAIVIVAGTCGWIATAVASAVVFTSYWYFGVPADHSFRLDDDRNVVALAAMATLCVGITVLVRQIESVVWEVRRLDRLRQNAAKTQAEIRAELEEDRQHLEKVVGISTQLAAARTPTEVADAVLDQLDIPVRPASCSIAVVEDDHLRFLAARNAGPEGLAVLERARLSTTPWLARVLAGEPALVDDREEFAAANPDAGVLLIYPAGSWAVIPFHSNDTVGLLSMHFLVPQPLSSLRRTYSIIAELLANALERAIAEERQANQLAELEGAFAERDRIARTLSTTLLPPTLPTLPGFDGAGWLVPASDDQVAGDFYDLFPVGHGDWVAVLGDVCGKGAEAAAVTSLARYAARATALHDPDPAHVVDVANTALLTDPSDLYCTMVVASYSSLTGELSVTLAGHHNARVISDGKVHRVGQFASPLGYGTRPATSERVPFGPGDAVVLFTDGLIERDPAFGEDELDAFLERGGSASDLAAELLEHAARLDPRRADDIAVLVVSCDPDRDA
jgi:sigma-B regulation protein RsbU (phosphoserine phosphatase)